MGQKAKDGERKLAAFSVLEGLGSKLALYLELGLDDLQFMERQACVDQSQVIIPVWEVEVRPLGHLKIAVANNRVTGVMFCGVEGTFRETHDGWEPLPAY